MKKHNAEQFLLFAVAVKDVRADSHVVAWKASIREEKAATKEANKSAKAGARASVRAAIAALKGETVAERVQRRWERDMRKATVVDIEVEEHLAEFNRSRWNGWLAGFIPATGKSGEAAFEAILGETKAAMLISERPAAKGGAM